MRLTSEDLVRLKQKPGYGIASSTRREVAPVRPVPDPKPERHEAPALDTEIGGQNCLTCGKWFKAPKSQERKYCSPVCAYKRSDPDTWPKPKDRGSSKCENCGKEFVITRNSGEARYCCLDCARPSVGRKTMAENRRVAPITRLLTTVCPNCDKPFDSWASSRRIYCSVECSAKIASQKTMATNHARGNYAAEKSFTRGKSGWVDCGGKRFFARSSWEANYGRYLQFQKEHGLIAEWEHEPETFWFHNIKRGVRSYLPDFRVTASNGTIEYHEVKGWMDSKSRTKIRRMAKYYPAITLLVIEQTRYKSISKTARHVVQGWS